MRRLSYWVVGVMRLLVVVVLVTIKSSLGSSS